MKENDIRNISINSEKIREIFPIFWIFIILFLDFFECGSLQNHSLPTLPSQWETAIEVTDIKNNLTTTIYEYYDYINNRIRVDFVYHNIRISEIMDIENVRFLLIFYILLLFIFIFFIIIIWIINLINFYCFLVSFLF